MKVLLVHNFYRSSSPSGEDMVYRNEVELLKQNAIEVITYEKKNDDIASRFAASISTVWSEQTYMELVALIKKEKPDIAHFHNIWYLISPSAYYACRDSGVPVVQTLHNFRMFCANGLLLREGNVCEDCIGKIPWRSVVRGCYRNSWQYSLPVALSGIYHRWKKTWTEQVDAYIALTEFGKNKFIECGLPEEKIFIKPNFLSELPNFSTSSQQYAVFIGRLSKEKGIDVLIDAFQILASSHLLNFKIVGDGPLKDKIMGRCEDMKIGKSEDGKLGQKIEDMKIGKSEDGKLGQKIEDGKIGKGTGQEAEGVDIEFTGRKSHQECMELLKKARFLVMPALCYENFPLSIVEAFACGKPVVASRLGVMADIVEDKKTGLLFNPGDPADLAEKISWMIENKEAAEEMGRNARSVFEEKYTAERNVEMLMDIYEKTLRKAGK